MNCRLSTIWVVSVLSLSSAIVYTYWTRSSQPDLSRDVASKDGAIRVLCWALDPEIETATISKLLNEMLRRFDPDVILLSGLNSSDEADRVLADTEGDWRSTASPPFRSAQSRLAILIHADLGPSKQVLIQSNNARALAYLFEDEHGPGGAVVCVDDSLLPGQ